MKKFILLLVSLMIIVLIPLLLFNVLGFHYEAGIISAENVVEDTMELIAYGSPLVGTEEHDVYRDELIKRFTDLGYTVELQKFKQLGPVLGEHHELYVQGLSEVTLYAPPGGRSIGTDFTGDMVTLNLVDSYEPEVVQNRFVLSTGFVDLNDVTVEKLYDDGCKGIILANGNYSDGGTQLNYAKLDGKTMPIFFVTNEVSQELLELAKKSPVERKKTSYGTSYTTVDFFDAGVIESIEVKFDKDIEIIECQNIIATLDTSHKNTLMIGTHYDGDSSEDVYMTYYNTSSVATILSIAERLKIDEEHMKQNIELVLFDGGLLDQSGVKYYNEHKETDYDAIYLDRLGFGDYTIFSGDNESNFLAEKVYQYDLTGDLTRGSVGLLYRYRIDSPGAKMILSKGEGILISSDPSVNVNKFYSGEKSLEAINLQPVINILDSYLEVEVFEDHFPDYMNKTEWLLIIVFMLMAMILVTVHQLRKLKGIRAIYYSMSYSIFKALCNIIFIVTFTLMIILFISIMPETYNINGVQGSNLRFYTLWHQMTQILRAFYHNGLGMSSTGIPYSEIIIQNSMNSFKLLSISLVIATALGLFIGLLGSYLKKSHNQQQSILVIFGLSIPETVLVIVLLFSLEPLMKIPLVASLVEVSDLRTIYMPIFTMALIPTIYISRMVYMTMVEETKKKYIRSLKAKGVKKNRIYTHHLLKVAFSKVMNNMTIILAISISTMIISETQFAIPGVVLNILRALNDQSYLYYMGLVLSIMIYYYIVILTSRLLSRILIPRSGGAYEIE